MCKLNMEKIMDIAIDKIPNRIKKLPQYLREQVIRFIENAEKQALTNDNVNDSKQKKIQRLISNTHVWSKDDIKAVEHGRKLINQWKIS
jgi:hypothetical protein